ncbi:MAG: hypothetical protein IIY78_03510 [Clostridia bacterium]|nr:hypothetical protein [Clostridia bacterium]
MDLFNEQLVIRKNNSKHIMKLIIYLMLIFTVPTVLFFMGLNGIGTRYFVVVAVCAFLFGIYGSYYLVTGLYVEYEYAVTNSNITIDKITAKRSRKRIISVDIKKLNTLRTLKDADIDHKSFKKIFKASVTETGNDVYAAEMHLDKFGGDCLLLFSPNEKTLNTMKPFLRQNVKAELIKAGVFKSASAGKTQPKEKSVDLKKKQSDDNNKK